MRFFALKQFKMCSSDCKSSLYACEEADWIGYIKLSNQKNYKLCNHVIET